VDPREGIPAGYTIVAYAMHPLWEPARDGLLPSTARFIGEEGGELTLIARCAMAKYDYSAQIRSTHRPRTR